ATRPRCRRRRRASARRRMASGPGGKGPDAGDLVGRAEGARAAGWLAPGLTALQPPREDEAGGVDRSALSCGVLRRRRSAVARSLLRLTWLVLGTAAYLGLAVFARGGLAEFFSHPALVALAVVLFALTGAAFFAGGNLSPGVREDRGNRWALPVFFVLGLL